MKPLAPTLNRVSPTYIIGLAYTVPDFVQRHITEEAGPLKLFDLLDLVNSKFKVRMTSGELYDMLRYAGCTMEKNEAGDMVFAGFSPAYEALRAARLARGTTRRDRRTPLVPKEDMALVAQNAGQVLGLVAKERLKVGESMPFEELHAMLVAAYPRYEDVAKNHVARMFYAFNPGFTRFSQRVGSTLKRCVHRRA